MRNLIYNCEGAYSFSSEDTETYGTGWIKLNETHRTKRDAFWVVDDHDAVVSPRHRQRRSPYQAITEEKSGSLRRRKAKKGTASSDEVYYVVPEALLPDGTVISCADRWEHFTASELKGFPLFGILDTYSGGGYVANLGYNEETGWTVLADLHSHDWLDRRTRSIIVEFTIYNANINLFATAFLVIEILPTGGAFPHSDFKIFNGYRYALDANVMSRLVELLFVVFIIYFTVREMKKLVKLKWEYFKSFFNIIEIILVPLYFLLFYLIILRWILTARNIRQYKENPKDFVSFQYSAAADTALTGVMGVIVFLVNIKFLKLFQFCKSFYGVGIIMKSFCYPLINFCLAFGLYFFLFAAVAHLGFGAKSENYKTLIRSVVTQMLHLLGETDFENLRQSHSIFGPVYYMAFSLFMFLVMFNMFLAIICDAINSDFEEEALKKIGEVDLIGTLMNSLKSFLGFHADNLNYYDDEEEDPIAYTEENMKKLENSVDTLLTKICDYETSEYLDSENHEKEMVRIKLTEDDLKNGNYEHIEYIDELEVVKRTTQNCSSIGPPDVLFTSVYSFDTIRLESVNGIRS